MHTHINYGVLVSYCLYFQFLEVKDFGEKQTSPVHPMKIYPNFSRFVVVLHENEVLFISKAVRFLERFYKS
jgi:hypothetical protein